VPDAEDFLSFQECGFAKAAWNFSVRERKIGTVVLSTETRSRTERVAGLECEPVSTLVASRGRHDTGAGISWPAMYAIKPAVRQKIEDHGLSIAEVEVVLAAPEQQVPGYGGRLIYQSRVGRFLAGG
jgi:hypothetical protein